jgi:hypothetical protein
MTSGEEVVVDFRRSLDDDAADSGWAQAVDKFNGLATDVLSADSRQALVALVDGLEHLRTMSPLIEATRLCPAAVSK